MRACIHRGSREIGGTCIELESCGRRLVLDVGLPLDAPDPGLVDLHPVPGFRKADPSLLGVVISHPHQDHYGLAHRLPAATPFLIGAAAERILSAAAVFSPAGVHFTNVLHLKNRQPMELGPFTITPFQVDHSAYDAFAVHVAANGAGLFYSGDLRAHGRKAPLFDALLRRPPQAIDVLLMEGTTIGRPDASGGFATERELERRLVAIFRETVGMPLVWCSGQNIDRIVTVYRACKRARRQLIIDMYVAHILAATENPRVPQAHWPDIRVFLPESQKRRIKRDRTFEVARLYRDFRIFPEELAAAAPQSVMLFRPSMAGDMEKAGCLAGSRLVCSIWSGYLADERNGPFLDWLTRHDIPLVHCHTSGHASVADLRRLRAAFPNAPVVPIHSDHPGRFEDLFANVRRRADGEWWDVEKT